jgi:hypothetical protein
MTTAKPQHFSDQSDSSDDLIAELARMMAQEAQGDSPEQATVPVKTPDSEPQAPGRAPPHISGIAEGHSNPAPAQRPALDFGRPPAAAPVIVAEPLSNWQNYSSNRRAEAQSPARQEPTMGASEPRHEPALHRETFVRQESHGRREPDFGAASIQPAVAPTIRGPVSQITPMPVEASVEPEARNAWPEPAASADFDERDEFSFPSRDADDRETDRAAHGEGEFYHQEPEHEHREPKRQAPPAHSEQATYDAIADLIAAELDDEEAEPESLDSDDAPLVSKAGEANPVEDADPSKSAPAADSRPSGNPLLRPVNFTARETATADRFNVAPVFGLGGRATPRPEAPKAPAVQMDPQPASQPFAPARQEPVARQEAPVRQEPAMPRHQPIGPAMAAIAPHVTTDPIDEIESLLGETVRVELAPPSRPTQPPTPVVSTMNAPSAPQRTSIPVGNGDNHASTAEDAILAAAAASSAGSERWDLSSDYQPTQTDRNEKPVKAKPAREPKAEANEFPRRRSAFKTYIVSAVAGVLLLSVGLGLYWVLGTGHTDGTAPVLTADTAAVKEVPAAPAADATDPSGSVVFSEIDGKAPAENQEQIVSRDQTEGEDVARVIAPQTTETGLANRKVRTVTVRPDGTIVSANPDGLAGTEILPVDRPNVPALPGQPADASDLLSGVAAPQVGMTAPPLTADPALTGTPLNTITPPPAEDDPTAIPDDPATSGNAIGAPVPMPRPAFRDGNASIQQPAAVNALVATMRPAVATTNQTVDLIGNLASASLAEPAALPVAAVRPLDTPPAVAAYVQLSSQRSEADATASRNDIQRRFGSLFDGTALEVNRVDLGERGVFYRVRLPASSLQSASQICSNVKAGGGDCFIPAS